MWRWVAVVCLAGGLDQPAAPRVQAPEGPARLSVVQAVLGAQRRLGQPDCQLLSTDFQDGKGRTLADRLESSKFTAPDYLVRQILFVADDDAPQCRRDEVVTAFTAPGFQVVHVCTTRFAARFQRDRGVAEILVIH